MQSIKAYKSEKQKILNNYLYNPTDLSLISRDFVEFNESIGLPKNRNTGLPQLMTSYQLEYHDAIQNYHKVIVNKSRKIGATEAALRSIALNVFDRYEGHDVMVVAGNELRIAKEILKRFIELFKNKSSGYAMVDKHGNKWKFNELIRNVKLGNSPEIEFCNDTRIMAFAARKTASSQSFRGTDDVACIFVSEAAHTGMKNDQVIMTALQPNLANRDDGDFIIESTPNGKRGFFYDYWKYIMAPLKERYNTQDDREVIRRLKNDNLSLDWYPLLWDYTFGVNCNVLSKKYLNSERNNPKIDFEQEYCCSFVSSYNSAIKRSDLTFKDKSDKEYRKSLDLLDEIGRDYGSPDDYYRK